MILVQSLDNTRTFLDIFVFSLIALIIAILRHSYLPSLKLSPKLKYMN